MDESISIDQELTRIADLSQLGLFAAAEAASGDLLRLAPREPRAWFQWGVMKLQRDALAEAEQAMRNVVSLDPRNLEAWNILAMATLEQGKAADAAACARTALSQGDATARPWLVLGTSLIRLGHWVEAATAIRRLLQIDPQHAQAWCYLGIAEQQLRRFDAAEAAYQQSLALAPNDASTLAYYGSMLVERGHSQRAIELLRGSSAVIEASPMAWLILGQAHLAMADLPAAEIAYRRALQLSPQNEDARTNLALVLLNQWKLLDAEIVARQMLVENPSNARGWSVLGEIQRATGHIEDAISSLQHGVALLPDPERHNMLLLCMQYSAETTPETLLTAHCAWDAAYTRPLLPANPIFAKRAIGSRPLRIGFVSSDFRLHPIAFLALPALEALDKSKCEIVCYTDRLPEDEYTARFRATSKHWRSMVGMTVEEVANQIRQDGIDVLVDLMGHTGSGKTLFPFAYKPAPLQVTWLGYVGTTGMAAMDCLLADRFHVRTGEENAYVETVLRMPAGYTCYGPPAAGPDVGPLPSSTSGQITFGSFSNPAKFSLPLLQAWADILMQLPNARLLLKYGGLDQPEVQNRVRTILHSRGIAPDRISFEGWSPMKELLQAYNRIDLALDTQPYSGGLTTCEALWMGVPVITCPGQTFASRHATSHLTNAGYPQFIATDLRSYTQLAIEWANSPAELAILRSQMRDQVRNSPLCNAPRFADDFLDILVSAWQSRGTFKH